MVLAAVGLLALFPLVYSLLLSELSAPLFAMLLALVVRAMALEYRAQSSTCLRHWLDRIMASSSALATFIQGWCAGMIISAQPDGLSLVPLISGVGLMVINSLLACCWIGWRIGDPVQPLAEAQSWLWWLLALLVFPIELYLNADIWQQSWQRPLGKVAGVAIVILWISLLCGLYPWLVPHRFTLSESASSPATQGFVLVGAAIAMPLTLLYHSWSFWIERRGK
ncbi:cytochrome d ubiquinol oxidase subunit II [Pantoea sp. Eser]|nr:cytochrome d ubiquinol oxidase subunit II [Pantoea sp. Eser]